MGVACGFYSNVSHEVRPVSHYRATLAFKVYCTKHSNTSLLLQGFPAKAILNTLDDMPRQFGILLNYKYNADGRLHSTDKLIYDILTASDNYDVKKISVVVKESAVADEYEGAHHYESLVYSFDKEDREAILKGKKIKRKYSKLPFFGLKIKAKGHQWSRNEEDEIEHTGNESQGMQYHAVYLNYALIVERK